MTKNWMWLLLIVILAVAWYGWKTSTPAPNATNGGVNSTTNLSTKSSPEAVVSGEIIQSAIDNQPVVANDAGEATLINSMSQWVGDLNQSYNETTF